MTSVGFRSRLLVALVGVGIAAFLAGRALQSAGGDSTVFVKIGEGSTEIAAHARALLGEVVIVKQGGHDGQHFFLQALDPFYLHPEEHAVLDHPVYRARRMLYPTLAGGFGLLPPRQVLWGLLLINIAAVGVGSYVTVGLATELGKRPWRGLAFALNVGMIYELFIDGSGVVAWALGVAAILAITRSRPVAASMLLAGAVLAREVMLLVALGVALFHWRRNRRFSPALIGFPLGAAAIWEVWLRLRLAGMSAADPGAFDLPFMGILRSFDRWTSLDVLVALLVVGTGLWVVADAIRRPGYLSWGTAGFALLFPFLGERVWEGGYRDVSRALAPPLTAFLLLAFDRAPTRRPVRQTETS